MQIGHFDFYNMSFFLRPVDFCFFCIDLINIVLNKMLQGIKRTEIFHDSFSHYLIFIIHRPFNFNFCKLIQKVVDIFITDFPELFPTNKKQRGINFHRRICKRRCRKKKYIFPIAHMMNIFRKSKHLYGSYRRLAVTKLCKFRMPAACYLFYEIFISVCFINKQKIYSKFFCINKVLKRKSPRRNQGFFNFFFCKDVKKTLAQICTAVFIKKNLFCSFGSADRN